jgi:hypothetical protein
MDDEESLEMFEIPRYLSAPVYRWRAAGMMLTDEDLFAVLFISMVVWFAIASLGLGAWGYGAFTLDPFGFFSVGIGFAYAISFFHIAFPDDSLIGHIKRKRRRELVCSVASARR